ncbi:uncharacterized protein LOC142624885 [Castanea sativa]|uniref:uncharacterized protein LOC142624885 n=1 Tax=Castanea sativa TaxID=21020 RepID=UPI003F64B3DF
MRILNVYEAASGQKLNPDKSSVFFSPNTHPAIKHKILNILGLMQDSRHKKYLGLPSLIGKSKAQFFAKIKERVSKKLAGWKEKLLSIGGREVLIKAVAQAVPTYAWRSIHNSLWVLHEGSRWRVGNGKRIYIWDDRWLPTPTTYKAISPQVAFGNFPMVSLLIDEDTKWWKSDLVRSIFLPFEAESILKIPISYRPPEDQLIWIGNKRGTFTVKSAYYIAMKVVDVIESGESTAEHNHSFFWKKIWHLNVPPKLGKLSDLDLFFMVAWSILGNRNQAIHNDSAIPPSQVWEIVSRAFLDFNASRLNILPTHPPALHLWAAPPPGYHKINVDGASDEGGGNSCIGVIIRDPSSVAIGALSKVLPSCLPAEITEAFALLYGVLLAQELQIDFAIFESDAFAVILALSFGEAGGELGHILEEIRAALSIFSQCSFHHLNRDVNKAAHNQAKEAKFLGQTNIWKGTPPSYIM